MNILPKCCQAFLSVSVEFSPNIVKMGGPDWTDLQTPGHGVDVSVGEDHQQDVLQSSLC